LKIAIVGGSGNMGRWFAGFLLKNGQEVVVIGRDREKLLEVKERLGVEVATSLEAIQDADVALISVPVDSFEEVVKGLQPFLRQEQVVMDVCSLKVQPVAVMHRYLSQGLVLGTHPVFGPGAKSVRRQNFVLTPTNNAETELARKVKRYLEARGASVTLMSPERHDRLMAIVLGLAHFVAIVSAGTLLQVGSLKELEAVGGSTYKVLLTLVESVISEDPELYASLQMNLPGLAGIEELFQRNTRLWADIVKKGNKGEFVKMMRDLKLEMTKGNPHFRRAYEDMYRMLESL